MGKIFTLGTRLGLGFGVVLLLMLVMVVAALNQMKELNEDTDRIANEDWVKAQMAMTVDAFASANGRGTMELFLAGDKAQLERVRAAMGRNDAAIAAALAKLDTMVVSPEGKGILARIKEVRGAYATSAASLQAQLADGKRDQAARLLNAETLPLLDRLEAGVKELVAHQARQMEASVEESRQTYTEARRSVFLLSSIAAVCGLLCAVFLTRSVTRQLGGEPDYVADIARRVADGDLTLQVHTRDGDRLSVLAAMKTMVEKLCQVVAEVNTSAGALASASEEVSATAQSLSQAASEQAAGVEETSASIEQMTASISQNTENARVTDGMATKAAQEASEGGEAVKATVAAMNQIARKIVIIDDIAYQTNLLALNAAIEAARAGEHGKGFAVVAAEVRKLAERSQVAAQEIGEVAASSVELAAKAGRLLDEMVPNIKKTSDLVQEITAASEEQSSGVGQINGAVGQLSQTTQQNASSSEELAATAEEMSGQAEQLQRLMSFFRLHGGAPRASVTPLARASVAARARKADGAPPRPSLPPVERELDEAHFGRF